MVIGSHNSWSFLKPRKWWMRLLGFTAKCQRKNIMEQYEDYNVRMFDLRVRFYEHTHIVKPVHGFIEYYSFIYNDLDWLNDKGDVAIRVILDVRTKKQYTQLQRYCFKEFCEQLVEKYPNIKFVCGDNLYNHQNEYNFGNPLSIEELYSSVRKPKIIDDWFPWIYAKLHNKKNIAKGTDKDVLMIDFVDIQ